MNRSHLPPPAHTRATACSMCGSTGEFTNTATGQREQCVCRKLPHWIPPVPYTRGLGEIQTLRTPEPPTTVLDDGLQRGNDDLAQSEWTPPPKLRECPYCMGKGVSGRTLPGGGNLVCTRCLGAGRVLL